ncbi:MAG: hypothetical protein SNJ58_13310 [Aggregatilineales bacterium]
MRRLLPYLALMLVIACGSAPTAQPVPPPPRAVVFAPSGERLPSGSLLVVESGLPRAILPDGRAIALAEPQQGWRGAPNGAYGVAFAKSGSTFDLALVDYTQDPPALREIPEGRGLINPVILWQPSSAGFVFHDLPLLGGVQSPLETLYYYRLSDGERRPLLSAERRVVPLAFSPDGVYLLYGELREDSEAIGAQSGTGYLLNLLGGQPIALPEGALLGFSGWLGDSSGFLSLRDDPQTGRGYLTLYRLTQLAEPQRLSAERDNVTLAASAPDGAHIALAIRTAEGDSTLGIVRQDGSGWREVYRFAQGENLVVLLWTAPETIYFSTLGSQGERTWRITPSGGAPTQVAEGLLQGVVR